MSSLHKYCSKIINPGACFVNEITDLIEHHFGPEMLCKNKFVLDSLLSNMNRQYGNDAPFSACFIKLTNMGGILNDDMKLISRNVPSEAFFNYVNKNDVIVNDRMISCAIPYYHLCEDVRDWVYEKWAGEKLGSDIESLCQIVQLAHYDDKKTYLDKIMQKMFDHVDDIGIVVAYVIANCQYVDETDKIMIYASESADYDNLRLFEIIKHFWANNEPDRLRNKNANLFGTEKEKINKLIKEDEGALHIYENIKIILMKKFAIDDYNFIMNKVAMFANLYYA